MMNEIIRARAYLLRAAEPPAPAVAALVAERGPIEAAALVRAGEVLEKTATWRRAELAEEDLANAERAGARLVVPEDGEWPARQIAGLADAAGNGLRWAVPPLGLWVRGSARLSDLVDRAGSPRSSGLRSSWRSGWA